MELHFINHAGCIFKNGEISLLCDPWLQGTCFNEGWSLVSPSPEINWEKINYIWFSHEHPDHFHPQSIKLIPEKFRSKICIIYQETRDKKILQWCKKEKFKVLELKEYEWVELSKNLRVKNGKMPNGDSWLLIDDGKTRFLNFNDCEIKDRRFGKHLQKKIGPVDVLATQFSYASWVGDRREDRAECAKEKLSDLYRQESMFKPKNLFLFASFSWFSHPECQYNNDEINRIDKVYKDIKSNIRSAPIVMYPDQKWNIGESWDNEVALKKYALDYDRIFSSLNSHSDNHGSKGKVDLDDLIKISKVYAQRLRKNNYFWGPFRLKQTIIYLTDFDKVFTFDYECGLKVSHYPKVESDISMSSQVMSCWFKFDWGGATTYISGRMKSKNRDSYRKTYQYFYVSNGNNRGESWPWFDIKRRFNRRIRSFLNSFG